MLVQLSISIDINLYKLLPVRIILNYNDIIMILGENANKMW